MRSLTVRMMLPYRGSGRPELHTDGEVVLAPDGDYRALGGQCKVVGCSILPPKCWSQVSLAISSFNSRNTAIWQRQNAQRLKPVKHRIDGDSGQHDPHDPAYDIGPGISDHPLELTRH